VVTVIMLLYGGHMVIAGTMTAGTIVAFLQYRAQVEAPARMLGFLVTMATRAQTSGARIFEIIDTVSEIQEKPGAPPLEDVEGHVRYADVSFSYSRRAPVVHNIDIDARPGEMIAILGPTGSGRAPC
jgi:ATP-binding cassette subfamily B protein